MLKYSVSTLFDNQLFMSWKKVRLGGLVNKIRTINPTEKLADESILYVDISAVDTKQKTILDPKEILGSDAPSRARQVLLSGDVLVSTVRPNLNAVALFTNDYPNVTVASTGFCVLRPQEDELDSKYLFYWSQSIGFISSMIKKSSGANYPAVSDSIIKSEIIPLPPLPTQKHIASILDKADALRQQNRQLLAHYDALLQSTFIELFGDPVENPKGWEVKKIRDLVSEVKYGTSKPAEDLGSFKYLRMNNISYEGFWDFASLKYINLEKNEISKYTIRKGDLIFNRTNSKELVGKTAVYNLDEPMAIAGYLIRVRTNEKAIPEYIWGYLNSKHGKATLRNMCKSIVGMANINAQELQEIDVFLPDLSLQQKFSKIVNEIESQKQQAKAALAESEALFQGLLAGYFGEN